MVLLYVQVIYCDLHIDRRRFAACGDETEFDGVVRGQGRRALALVMSGAAAQAQAAGLPRTYNVQRIDSPEPRPGGSFGWGITSADLTGGRQARPARRPVPGLDQQPGVRLRRRQRRAHRHDRPPSSTRPPTLDPALSFVYVETMPDLGSCPRRRTRRRRICERGESAPATASPRSSPARAACGSTRSTARPGRRPRTRARARLRHRRRDARGPQARRHAAGRPRRAVRHQRAGGRAAVRARHVLAAGDASVRRSGAGEQQRRRRHVPDVPRSTRIGDLNGDGIPDIVITARNFVRRARPLTHGRSPDRSAGTRSAARLHLRQGVGLQRQAIAGTDPHAILDTRAVRSRTRWRRRAGRSSAATSTASATSTARRRADDCFAPPVAAACAPEFVIPARNLSYPLAGPFGPEFNGVGAAFLFNGSRARTSPPPAARRSRAPSPRSSRSSAARSTAGARSATSAPRRRPTSCCPQRCRTRS